MSDADAFELAAALLRVDGSDLLHDVEVLAGRLEATLPRRTRIARRRVGLLSRARRIDRIEVDFDETSYRLEVDGDRVETSRAKEVRGVVIRTEPLELEAWLAALARDVAAEARTNAQARAALERMVG